MVSGGDKTDTLTGQKGGKSILFFSPYEYFLTKTLISVNIDGKIMVANEVEEAMRGRGDDAYLYTAPKIGYIPATGVTRNIQVVTSIPGGQ